MKCVLLVTMAIVALYLGLRRYQPQDAMIITITSLPALMAMCGIHVIFDSWGKWLAKAKSTSRRSPWLSDHPNWKEGMYECLLHAFYSGLVANTALALSFTLPSFFIVFAVVEWIAWANGMFEILVAIYCSFKTR